MAKETNGTWKKVGVIAGILVVLLGAAVAYGMLCAQQTTTTERSVQNTEDIGVLKQDVATIKANQDMMIKSLERVERKMDE